MEVLSLLAATGLDECKGVRDLRDLADCVALCKLSEEVMLQLDLVTAEELEEIRSHDNISPRVSLALYLEVFQGETGYAPFVDCETTVGLVCDGREDQAVELCTWLLERYAFSVRTP